LITVAPQSLGELDPVSVYEKYNTSMEDPCEEYVFPPVKVDQSQEIITDVNAYILPIYCRKCKNEV